jgi:hypothetical protein
MNRIVAYIKYPCEGDMKVISMSLKPLSEGQQRTVSRKIFSNR